MNGSGKRKITTTNGSFDSRSRRNQLIIELLRNPKKYVEQQAEIYMLKTRLEALEEDVNILKFGRR